MASTNTLKSLATGIARALSPLQRVFSSLDDFAAFMLRLGWSVESLPAAYVSIAEQAEDVLDDLETLSEDPSPSQVIDALANVRDLIAAIDALDVAPAGVDTQPFLDDIKLKLVETLLLDHLASFAPSAFRILRSARVIREESQGDTEGRPGCVRFRFAFDEVSELLRDPSQLARFYYGWGTEELEYFRVIDDLFELFTAMGQGPRFVYLPEQRRLGYDAEAHDGLDTGLHVPLFETIADGEAFVGAVAVYGLQGDEEQLPGFLVEPVLPEQIDPDTLVGHGIDVQVVPEGLIDSRFGVLIRPGELRVVHPLDEVYEVPRRFGVRVSYRDTAPRVLLGRASGTRVQATGAAFELVLARRSDGVELSATLDALDLEFVIAGQSADVDGFVAAALQTSERRIPVQLGIRWSSRTGLALRDGSGFSASIPVNRRVGPVSIESATVDLRTASGEPPRVVLELGVDAAGTIGPLTFTISGLGLRGSMALDQTTWGPFDLGPLDLALGVKPPHGVGLVVSSSLVRGGGFLARDASASEYRGALELEAAGARLSAYGLLATRLPGVDRGYSLIAAISTQFAPVPLGLGFTLDGVGGLLGIHRRVDVDALRAALRGDGLADIFFGADPVAHAARLLGDLGRYFPAAEGRHVFGPAFKLGWGTPTIVEATLAVLLEVPAPVRLVLLGSARARLPRKENPLIDLGVDVVGEVDFARKTVAIDASLRDSKVAGFPVTGDLAFRMGWGSQPNFVLSVGGFHSAYQPPPGFPELRRVRIPIGSGDNPRLDVQGFLALTSNTAQVGANVDLYAEKWSFNIKGSLGFEALFQFSPFAFQVDLWGGIAFRRGTTVLAGVHFDGTLSGPTPYHVKGEACLSTWAGEVCIHIDAAFGRRETVELPKRKIWDELEPALEERGNWSSALPAGVARVVTTASPPDGTVRIDPVSTLTVRQKVAPLGQLITRFAQVTPEDTNLFIVTGATIGATSVPFHAVTDWFAPAQFEALSDAERLSRPGFEKMTSGVTLAASAVTSGFELTKDVEYETIVIPEQPPPAQPYRPSLSDQLRATELGAVASAPLRKSVVGRYAPPPGTPPKVILHDEEFVIASTVDLAARFDIVGATSRAQAEQGLAQYLAEHPEARGLLQVVPAFEVEEAA